MKDNKSIIGFIFNPKIPFLKERYDRIREETGKYLVTPLKVIALMVAISGIFAMIFEVRHHAEYSFDIYLVRLSATLVAFIILVFLTSKNATKYTIPLVHILLHCQLRKANLGIERISTIQTYLVGNIFFDR